MVHLARDQWRALVHRVLNSRAKKTWISLLTDQLSTYQARLCSIELVNQSVSHSVSRLFSLRVLTIRVLLTLGEYKRAVLYFNGKGLEVG